MYKHLIALFFAVSFLSLAGCLGDDDDVTTPSVCEEGLISVEEFAAADTAYSYTELDDTGLLYHIIEPGTGDKVKVSDTLIVAYRGTVTNGRLFDSRPADNPARFPLSGLIEGWKLALPLVAEGGKIRLLIPAQLAYGSRGSCNAFGQCSICPDSDLVFDIEVIDIVN